MQSPLFPYAESPLYQHCITPVILPVVCPFLTYSASTGAPHCLLHSSFIPWIFHQYPLCFPISIFSRKYLRRCRSHDIYKIRKCNNDLLHLPAEWYFINIHYVFRFPYVLENIWGGAVATIYIKFENVTTIYCICLLNGIRKKFP